MFTFNSSKVPVAAALVAATLSLGACSTLDNMSPTEKRVVYGAGAGAAAGAVVGGVSGGMGGAAAGTLIGGALGAGGGYLYDQYKKGKL